ncbi:hypothetical protein [Acinetobacter proteolyticus]|uniref:Uncharacterized protein n=1 Tax=Acinetobacter proteolyticus TaxID=1776741 RepID=A0A2N0WIA2_9GAMM|nr:hypothetical protein [Acinetobacter proteolyticus]PKF35504.1 hypothetical protein CW311_04235 [Acinetobacter proteolyticus]
MFKRKGFVLSTSHDHLDHQPNVENLAEVVAQNSLTGLIQQKKREDLYSVFVDLNTTGQNSWSTTCYVNQQQEIVDIWPELERQRKILAKFNHDRLIAFLCLAQVLHTYMESQHNRPPEKRFVPEAGRKTGLVQAEKGWLIDGYYSRAFDQNRVATIKITDLI